MTTATHPNLADILQLLRTPYVGVSTYLSLISLYKTPDKALANVEKHFALSGKKNCKLIAPSVVEKEIAWYKNNNAKLLYYENPTYPPLLKQISNPPILLSALGNTQILEHNTRLVSVVGARNCSLFSHKFSGILAGDLALNKFIVVSGLAVGVDTSAHKSSLQQGTVAVIAGGLEHIYPAENIQLLQQLLATGCVLSEMPPAQAPLPNLFSRRNRIIAGLSFATCIIECALKSGSMITANYCLDYNRELFVMPSFPLDPKFAGNIRLLKNGAHILEQAHDLNLSYSKSYFNLQQGTNQSNYLEQRSDYDSMHTNFSDSEIIRTQDRILELLSFAPTKIEELIQNLNVPTPLLLIGILNLELGGFVIRDYANNLLLMPAS